MNALRMFGSVVINVAEAIATTPVILAETLCLVGRDASFATAKAAIWTGNNCESGRKVCEAAKTAIRDQAVVARVKHHIKTAKTPDELASVPEAEAIEPDLYKEKVLSFLSGVTEAEIPASKAMTPEAPIPMQSPPKAPAPPAYTSKGPDLNPSLV